MRSALLVPAVVAAMLAPASPAAAAGCVAYAMPPQAVGGQVYGDGYVSCAAPTSMTVMVCIEALRGTHWRIHTCETASGYATTVGARAWACVQDAPLVRTFVLGSTADGEYPTATSVPSLPGIGSCGP